MKLLILDGNSIINRAFYGVHLLATRDGQYTNAVYGFLNILHKLTEEEKPDALCVAFDRKEPTFRHEKYELYKANRHGMPEELASQMPVMKDVLRAMRIPVYECAGWEADDIIGTVGRICGDTGWNCVIATGDRDSLQLVSDAVTVRLSVTQGKQTDWRAYTPETFRAEYGFDPEKIVDLKALMGDSSDNIPGVNGIGPKTAGELIRTYGDLDGVYQAAKGQEIRESLRTKLRDGEEMARLSYDLATIRREAPIDFAPEKNLVQEPDREELYELFRKLEFVKLMSRYDLHPPQPKLETADQTTAGETVISDRRAAELLRRYEAADAVTVLAEEDQIAVDCGGEIAVFTPETPGWEQIRRELFSGKIQKVSHETKELTRRLLDEGADPAGFVFDSAVAAYLLDPTQGSYDLDRLCARCLKQTLPETIAGRCAAIAKLRDLLEPELDAAGLRSFYREVELPLCRVLAEMEHEGVALDQMALAAFGAMLKERIDRRQREIYDFAGEEFNINSTKQLGTVLFEDLGLPPVKKTKTGYSTGAEILEKLKNKHPIIPAILDYRMLTKLDSTYAEGLLKVIDEDGRIRTTFQNTVTATGRLSSTNPNLQNIPVRTEMGSEIRKMFIPRPGWQFVDADYSQIELRVLAHIADDKAMQAAFTSGEDYHTATAAQVFGVPVADVTPQMRRSAKAVNFGIVYGISEFSLAEDLGVSRAEARSYMDAYLDRFSGVRAYMENVVKQAYEDGFVSTLSGRKRRIPELQDKNRMLRMAGERIALNTPIQGTAADIMKIATVRVADALRTGKLQAKLVLQVHDELIVECPPEETEQVKTILIREMEHAADLSVPLNVEANAGCNWYEAK